MANIRKKVINTFDGGIKTNSRSSDGQTSDGAQMIKHFDIFTNSNKLIPMPSWSSFVNEEEKAYNIMALANIGNTVYGLGRGLKDWYGVSWLYRIKVTLNPTYYTANMIMHLDLSLMGSDFWNHTRDDLYDVKVCNKDNQLISSWVENLDHDAQTGDLWFEGVSVDDGYVYIYYGNADFANYEYGSATANATGGGSEVFDNNRIRFAYTFAEDVYNKYYGLQTTESFTTEPNYYAGSFGKSIMTPSYIRTDSNDEVALTGSDISISFQIKLNAFPGIATSIIKDINGSWEVNIDATGHVRWFVDGVSGSATKVSSVVLSLNTWYTVDCTYDGTNYYIYINNSKETFVDNNGNYEDNVSGNMVQITTNDSTTSFCYLANVFGYDNDLTDAEIATKYNNYTNASFFTISSEESFSNNNFNGFQIYKKDIVEDTLWSDYVVGNGVVKGGDKYPLNGFIAIYLSQLYFIVTYEDGTDSYMDLTTTDSLATLDTVLPAFGYLSTANKLLPSTSLSNLDSAIYFAYASSFLGRIGGTGTDENAFSASFTIASIINWRSYLAIGGTSRNRAKISLWDFVSTQDTDFIDAGTGNLRIVGTAGDTLFFVVDNYTDNEVFSSNQPKVDIRYYTGNGNSESLLKLQVPTVYDEWTSFWERGVSTFQIQRNSETLFYMKIPADDTASTFHEGFWAVGKNLRGNLALTLMIDTKDLGEPKNVYGFAQQVFFVQKDGGIQRLDTDNNYNKTSLYTTLKMNEGNTEIEKKLHGVEIITEPLEANQVVSVYYKVAGDTVRTKIGEISGEGEISKEMLYDDNGDNLNNYKEVEFDIESTGGKSAVLEFNYKYEYLSDIV